MATSATKGVCAVVGVGPGLGASAALKFAREGFKIAGMSRKPETFEPTAAKLKEIGAEFAHYPMDATDADAVKKAFAAAVADLGTVNVLVYNTSAGFNNKTVMEIDPQDFVRSLEATCVGALLCSQAVIPGMLASEGDGGTPVSKKGTIIYSSATAAFRAGPTTAQFACGKFALRALSQSVAKEYGKQGIHACHARLDGILDIPKTRAAMPEMYEAQKMASTDEIANIYFSLSQQSPMAWSNEVDIRPFQEGWTC